MHTMPETEVFVTVGVDTHKDVHVAVALDQLGRFLDANEIPTTTVGYAELLAWASQLGTVDKVGIEGTGSHGAGLCRWLSSRGVVVVEVDRPDRGLRRNKGKSDTIDAESPARNVLSGEATAVPLGHADEAFTARTYAAVLNGQGADAAATLAALVLASAAKAEDL